MLSFPFSKLQFIIPALGILGWAIDFSIPLFCPSVIPSSDQKPFLVACLILTALLIVFLLLLSCNRLLKKSQRKYVLANIIVLILQFISYFMIYLVSSGTSLPGSIIYQIVRQDIFLFNFLGFMGAISLPYFLKKHNS